LPEANPIDTFAANISGVGNGLTIAFSGDAVIGSVDGFNGITTNGGDVNITVDGGGLTQTHRIISNGLVTDVTGTVDLTNPSNDVVEFGASTIGGDFSYTDATGFTINSLDVSSGAIYLVAGGDVTLFGSITADDVNLAQAGQATIIIPMSGSAITADNGGVSFTADGAITIGGTLESTFDTVVLEGASIAFESSAMLLAGSVWLTADEFSAAPTPTIGD